jgi:hypothetical protein
MRQRSEAISTVEACSESPCTAESVRILIIDTSPSCRLTIATPDRSGDCMGKVKFVKGTPAGVMQGNSDSWDLIITHGHVGSVCDPSAATTPIEAVKLGGYISRRGADDQRLDAPQSSSSIISRRKGIFRRLFSRRKLSSFETQERGTRRSMVLAEMQREIGVALSAIEMGDFDTIGEIASRLRNDGANRNSVKLSSLGAALYETVPRRDIRTARIIAQKLMTYMGKTSGFYAA